LRQPIVNEDRQWWIYLLVDPRITSGRAQDEVRYVGFSVDVSGRLDRHLRAAGEGSKLPCHRWVRKLLYENLIPTVRVVDTGFGDSWKSSEIFWIAFYKYEVDAILLNRTDGGDGVLGCRWSLTPEQLQFKSLVMKGRKFPEDFGRRISEAKKSRHLHYTDEQKSEQSKRLIGKNVGKKRSPEARAKTSAASIARNAGQVMNEKRRAKKLASATNSVSCL